MYSGDDFCQYPVSSGGGGGGGGGNRFKSPSITPTCTGVGGVVDKCISGKPMHYKSCIVSGNDGALGMAEHIE